VLRAHRAIEERNDHRRLGKRLKRLHSDSGIDESRKTNKSPMPSIVILSVKLTILQALRFRRGFE